MLLAEPSAKAPLMEHLKSRGIGSRPFYPPLHAEPAFARPDSFPITEQVSSRGLWLPSSLRLEDADIHRVCETIREFFAAR